MPETAEDVQLSIDYPKKEEKIASSHYTVRISAPEGGNVDISIDGLPFEPCRRAVGHWWYDWSGYLSGQHRAVVRLTSEDGRPVAELHSRFRVELEPETEGPGTGPKPQPQESPRARRRRH